MARYIELGSSQIREVEYRTPNEASVQLKKKALNLVRGTAYIATKLVDSVVKNRSTRPHYIELTQNKAA